MQKIKFQGGEADGMEITADPNKIHLDCWIDKLSLPDAAGGMIYTFVNPGGNKGYEDWERYWYDDREQVYKLLKWDIDFITPGGTMKYGEIYNAQNELQDYNIVQVHLESGTLTCQFTDLKGKAYIDERAGRVKHVEIKVWGIPLRFEERELHPVQDQEEEIIPIPVEDGPAQPFIRTTSTQNRRFETKVPRERNPAPIPEPM